MWLEVQVFKVWVITTRIGSKDKLSLAPRPKALQILSSVGLGLYLRQYGFNGLGPGDQHSLPVEAQAQSRKPQALSQVLASRSSNRDGFLRSMLLASCTLNLNEPLLSLSVMNRPDSFHGFAGQLLQGPHKHRPQIRVGGLN